MVVVDIAARVAAKIAAEKVKKAQSAVNETMGEVNRTMGEAVATAKVVYERMTAVPMATLTKAERYIRNTSGIIIYLADRVERLEKELQEARSPDDGGRQG